MEVLYEHCCGIDVNKKILVCCFKYGKKQEIRTFDSNNDDIQPGFLKPSKDGVLLLFSLLALNSAFNSTIVVFNLRFRLLVPQ